MLPSFTAEENQSSLVGRGLPLNVLSDELFVRMMKAFAVEKHFDIGRRSEVRTALLSCINYFSPDGIVMHMYMAIFSSHCVGDAFIYNIDSDDNVQYILYGIRTVLLKDDVIPYSNVLMIRNGEPNPTSLLLRFKSA